MSGGVVQYWSLDPLTCWAEYLRYNGIRDPDDASELLVRPWAAEIELPQGTIALSFESATAHGIDADALVDDDWTRCRRWVDGVAAPALIVPSAALPGGSNLVLMGPRVAVPYGSAPVDPSLDTATAPVASLATVIADLLRYVRWRGTPHQGLQAWRAGDVQPELPSVTVTRV